MTPHEALFTSFYIVPIVLGSMVLIELLQYFSVVKNKMMFLGIFVLLVGVVLEQLYYGAGRLHPEKYITFYESLWFVWSGKFILTAGIFILHISTQEEVLKRPIVVHSTATAVFLWIALAIALWI